MRKVKKWTIRTIKTITTRNDFLFSQPWDHFTAEQVNNNFETDYMIEEFNETLSTQTLQHF